MSGELSLREVFADTCVLLNFVQREWERDRSTVLIESDSVEVVISRNVLDEFKGVSKRRQDIYEDMVDFLNATNSDIEEYDPGDRRVYIGANDAGHVRTLQEKLATLDDHREVLYRLRTFLRAVDRRIEHLESTVGARAIDPSPPLELMFAIDRVLNHSADSKVVTDAAAWAAGGGSGVLVTLDDDDIFENEGEIVETLIEERGPNWRIRIIAPDDVVPGERLSERAD
jgi:hypothetical protein